MRRWFPLVILLAAGSVESQTRMIVGNTLVALPPDPVIADARGGYGKGHGRSGGAPAPSPAPAAVSAPAPPSQPEGEIGRGEGSFQFVPQGSVIIPPYQPAQVRMQTVPAQPVPHVEAPCLECGTQTHVISVPVQLQLRTSVQAQTQVQTPRCP